MKWESDRRPLFHGTRIHRHGVLSGILGFRLSFTYRNEVKVGPTSFHGKES